MRIRAMVQLLDRNASECPAKIPGLNAAMQKRK
jgi:hypothetical protein